MAWVAAFAAAVLGDTSQCTAADPNVCGPDQSFAWWFIVCAATPVLLWWLPLAGCAAGVAFAIADLAYDDVTSARIGFGLHGLACAVVAVWLLLAARRQEARALAATNGISATVPPPPPGEDAASGRNLLRLGAAALLVLCAVGSFGWYASQSRAERAHVQRAVEVPGQVVKVDSENSTITVIAGLTGDQQRSIKLGVVDTWPYDIGTTEPVLLDPDDPSWARLVAEPLDVTYWETIGGGALLLALLLVAQEARWARARRRLVTTGLPALRVRMLPDAKGDALVLPVDDEVPVATLPVWYEHRFAGPDARALARSDPAVASEGWDAETQTAFGRAWRGEGSADASILAPPQPMPAVLLGSIRERGWALALTEQGLLVPAGPLRGGARPADEQASAWVLLRSWLGVGSARWAVSRPQASGGDGEDSGLLPGEPVTPEVLRGEPALPLTARRPLRQRAIGALMVAAVLVAAPVLLLFLADNWYHRAVLVVAGGNVLVLGVSLLRSGVRLTRDQLEILHPLRVLAVPWDRVHGVRREGTKLAVAWEPDVTVEIGPFAAADGDRDEADRAEQLGAAMMLLRMRALAAGSPGREVENRRGPAWSLLVLYGVVMAGSWFALHH